MMVTYDNPHTGKPSTFEGTPGQASIYGVMYSVLELTGTPGDIREYMEIVRHKHYLEFKGE